ncbi:MAG: hypothetical protein HGB23_11715 [Chlorobiaceae bacterium]|nr:hypothetical protein [Chlorobiaceae bacterium]
MKRMLSLAAMFAVLSYASPASAELKLGGDAAIRLRDDFGHTRSAVGVKASTEDQYFQYRVRLKPSADLGDGYFFKGVIQNENVAGGWQSIAASNTEHYSLEVSQFYFGRNLENSHYSIGRIPLGSLDNPILDLTLYAIPGTGPQGSKLYAVDTPISTNHFDRLAGFNYGAKIGGGELNAVVVNFDNLSTTTNQRGLLNDGYGLYVNYKTTAGDVTVVPQAYYTLTRISDGRRPYTLGAQAFIPVGKSKVGLSGFYTADNNSYNGSNWDYSGYIFRVKGESGPLTAWVDYNQTTDKSTATTVDYDNLFVWASYKVNVHEAATGSFSITPTVRYRASNSQAAGAGKAENDLFRTEVYATVNF